MLSPSKHHVYIGSILRQAQDEMKRISPDFINSYFVKLAII